ncbi:MAG: PEP/pyruvate-binding domain-containing protein [Polyangiaceae bacterium]
MITRLASSVMLLAAVATAVLPGCGGDDATSSDDSSDLVAGGLAAASIKTRGTFDKLAFHDGGVLLPGKSVKLLIDARKPTRKIFYMNASYTEGGETPEAARFHYPFAQRVLKDFDESVGSFNDATYWTQDKSYFAGSVQTYQLGDREIYGIQFYPQDVISEERILDAVQVVKKTLRIPGTELAFVATGPQQTTATIADDLAALGVANMTIDEVLGGIRYVPMNQGEAWGYLRIFPTDQDSLSATDIAVFDELPLDLTVVAGTVTRAFQDPTSHVNLKSKERGTPNMILRDAGPDNERLAPYADKPVHMVVGVDDFVLEPSTDAEVADKLAEKMNQPWVALPYEPTDVLLSYRDMCPTKATDCMGLGKKYGSKATNLGFMSSAQVLGMAAQSGTLSAELGYDLVPAGMGLPMKLYADFVAHPANGALRDKLGALIAAEKAGTLSSKERGALVLEVQQLFYVAELPPGMEDAVRASLGTVLPGVNKIKVRSSANAEDIPNFDGAGLYTSFSATLSKQDNADGSCVLVEDGSEGVETKVEMSPKSLACALKGVFASTWNKRAIEERSYARLDHETAKMGIAIVPKYDLESEIAANSVVVTRVINSDGLYGYTFSAQVGNNLVTNPEPGTLSEATIAAFLEPEIPPTFVTTRFATPVAGGGKIDHTVLTEAQMQTQLRITQTVETAYCKAKPSYYGKSCSNVTWDLDKPASLDFEFKVLENGRFVAKQVREFSGQ